MTQTAFIHRGLSSWYKAFIALGAIAAAVLGAMAVAGGHSVQSELAVSSASSGHGSGGERSGTVVAYRLVY